MSSTEPGSVSSTEPGSVLLTDADGRHTGGMRLPHALGTLALTLTTWSCSDSDLSAVGPSPWTIVPRESLSGAQAKQYDRAVEARDALTSSLLVELKSALEKGGPTAAIPVCRERARELATEVSADLDLQIGRTSERLRNPANTAPAWAVSAVTDHGAAGTPLALEHGTDGLGVLFPIRIAPACLACHGSEESLGEGVTEALTANYPQDRATGYAEGDLRGWFWVELQP